MSDLFRLKIGDDKDTYMPAYITDRYTHTLLLGKSGTGKSTLILNWWEQDQMWGHAKILIDPSGTLAGDCYSISGGIYSSIDNPVSINPMLMGYSDSQISESIAEAINQVITIATPNERLFVRQREFLDGGVKYCLKNNRKSLLNVRDYIANIKGSADTREGIVARLNFILNDPKMEKMLCGNNALDIGEFIRKRKTLILDCHAMGTEKMIFVGSLVIQAIKNYFRFQKQENYEPLSVYIDECHNFLNPNVTDILKEGRRYKLSCVLATQDLALTDERMARVMLNSGNIVAYRLGNREAQYISKEMDYLTQQVQFLGKYHAAYLAGNNVGVVKTPRPPHFKPKQPPKFVEPPRKSTPSWFSVESYQPTSPP